MVKTQTPYFIFKPKVLEKNYKEFENLCNKYLQKFVIAYSVKTNSYQQLINLLDELGCNFEVASTHEINITPKKAKIFNGPCKTTEELEFAINNKFLINIDSKSEINKIYTLTKGKPFNIGLRISIKESKFGFDESQLNEIIKYAKPRNLNIICLQFHKGTQQSLTEFKENLEKASNIINKLPQETKSKLKYIDIGGGFPDKWQLKNLHAGLEDFFEAIQKNFKKFNLTIIIEPGRNLVADAFELITKIETIKENFKKNYAVLDAGINLLPKITLSQYKFSKLRKDGKPGELKEYILAGPLLFANDTLGKIKDSFQEGDLLKVENVGAYCFNLAWEISYKKPRIIIEE
jgi:diaminopimelate decarboxylase